MTRIVITLDKSDVDKFCEPYGSKKYYYLKGTKLLVRLKDRRIVTEGSDYLTDDQLKEAHRALRTAVNDANGRSNGENDRKWAETAVKRELEAIGRLHGDNPHLPDSEFWACLIRIASVIKGSGRPFIAPSRARTAVLRYAPQSLKTKGNREKDIEYLFGRAMNQARPRYRIKT